MRHRVLCVKVLGHKLAEVVIDCDLLDSDVRANARTRRQASHEGTRLYNNLVEASSLLLLNSLQFCFHEGASLLGLLVAEGCQESIWMVRILCAKLWSTIGSLTMPHDEAITRWA